MMSEIHQKHDYYSVQWYSADEFKKVFKLIYGPDSNETNKKKALEILLVWKTRCPVLPIGLESTLGLLEVDLQIPVNKKEYPIAGRLLRLMYSSVIMRFINHMLDDAQSKKLSLMQAAEKMNIPQWVINLRHETAHGHELPSLNLLKNAAHFAMNWLYKTYWVPQNSLISNYKTRVHIVRHENFENELFHLISVHNSLALLCYPSFDINTVADIPYEDMKESLLSDIKSINISEHLPKKFENIKIQTLLNIVINSIEFILKKHKNVGKKNEIFASVMCSAESLFMTDEIDFPNSSSKKRQGKLTKEYLSIWEPLLNVLHSQSIIAALLIKLLSIVESEEETHEKRVRVAQWIKEISLGLFKSKLFLSLQDKECHIQGMEGDLAIFNKYFPDQDSGLTLNLRQPVPHELSNIDFIYKVYAQIHPYLDIYANEVLKLMEPAIPQANKEKLLMLATIVSREGPSDNLFEKIYTHKDVVNYKVVHVDQNPQGNDIDMSESSAGQVSLECNVVSGKWQRASPDVEWGKCPIGVLPWQVNSTSENPLLPSF